MTFEIDVGGRTRNVEVRGAQVLVDGQSLHVDAAQVGHAWSLLVEPAAAFAPSEPRRAKKAGHYDTHGRSYEAAVVEHSTGDLTVYVNGCPVAVRRLSGRGTQVTGAQQRSRLSTRADVATRGPQRVLAPMPGRITRVLVTVGDAVTARQGLVVVEAMKMENELRSPCAGIVTEVPAVDGALVEAGSVLVIVE